MKKARNIFLILCAAIAFAGVTATYAQDTSQVPPFPNDMSVAGLQAMTSESGDSTIINGLLAPEVLQGAREYIKETQAMGLSSRAGRFSISAIPTNVRANNPAGDRIGDSQSEVAVAVHGDTVVIGWNDSRGFSITGSPGLGTLSGFGYSLDGGATFTDGGTTPPAAAGENCFGDPGIDTDERGNWYYNQIYTKSGQQNIAVHHGRFVTGVLVWDPPTQALIGLTAGSGGSAMDKCLLACDRLTGNVYVSATRFPNVGTTRIEIARSIDHGVTWDAPIVLDNTTTPTGSKQAARPFCGPNGEVYVVWEKGANSINCPDASGNLSSFNGAQMAFTRSLDFGVTYAPFTVISNLTTDFMASGPGDLRERANEFPDIAVDRSGGPHNGNIYVTWHESAPWTTNTSAGPVAAEVNAATNNNPGSPDFFSIGDDATGSISPAGDLDYWQFNATQGQNLLIDLLPQGWNCGVSGTSRQMRVRLFATQSPYPNPTGFPDSLLAAGFQGSFEGRIVWTAPKTGSYLVRIQNSSTTTPTGTYRLRVRNLTFGTPSPARDTRDVVVVRSTDQGVSWSAKQLVNDDPAGLENRRPFICTDGLGNVHAFWHDSRVPGLGSNAALTSIFGTSSTDGGATWSPNYQATDELSFFSFNTVAVPNLGDYNQAAATADGIVHPAWTDQRISTGDVRIPGTNTFSAGLGPEAYTTAMMLPTITCPANITQSNDPGTCGAVVTYSVTATGIPAPTVVCTPPSGSVFPVGTTTVNCSASNGIGSPATCSFTVTVADTEKPSITGVSRTPASLWPPNHTMRDITVGYTATDNCPGSSCELSVSSNEPVNGLGDGDTSPDWEIVDATHVRLRAERSGLGTGRVYTIMITCTDAHGNTSYTTTNVYVTHNISDPISGAAFKIGTQVNFAATFWDLPGRTHTAVWNFDGLSAPGSVVEPTSVRYGTVRSSYTFTTAGVYKVKLTITDDLGGVSSVSSNGDLEALVVIYDPSAGFAVGGGWFDSPPGAFRADPAAAGKASFAFTSKYFKNAANPKGETQFQFSTGSLEFNTLNYSYLSIYGATATFKGFGKIGDDASYNFVMTVTDGQLVTGGDGIDRIRMRIWNKNTGTVVYDNRVDPGESDAAATPVGAGSSIVIKTTTTVGGTGESTTPGDDETSSPVAMKALPKEFGLQQSYPNPFNPSTTIGYDLPKDARVSLVIYNVLGEEIRRLVDSDRPAGSYHAVWDGTNSNGNTVVSGIYMYRLTALPADGGEAYVRVMKTIFMK